MSQYNKLSYIQYARFQLLPVDLHFGLFWSAGIPNMHVEQLVLSGQSPWPPHVVLVVHDPVTRYAG